MNLTEKRRAEKFIKEHFDPQISARAHTERPDPKPSATLVKKVEALHAEMVAAGFTVNFYNKRPEITVRNDHPAIVKVNKDTETRKEALRKQRDDLIHGVWAGTVGWDAVEKAIK